jgi:hypothetical protein
LHILMTQWKKWWLHIHGICCGGQFTGKYYAASYQHCHSSMLEIIDINVKLVCNIECCNAAVIQTVFTPSPPPP